MFPDGTDKRQITFGPGDKSYPKFSPDGTKLIYSAPGGTDAFGNDLGQDLWVLNLDGTGGVTNLTEHEGDDFDAVWSPDGSMLAFTSTRVGELRQIFLQEISCQPAPELCQLVGAASNFSYDEDFSAVEYAADWSDDGETLVVVGSINRAPGRLLLRPPEGGVPTYFDRRDTIVGADQPAWSPDGESIVFSYQYQRGIQEIYIAPLESPSYFLEKLTNSLGNKEPAVSPNGQYIVFTSTRDQNPEIYLMTRNGTGQTNLTDYPGQDLHPDWGPAP
jgi:Tol biopolymer transport system component